MKPFPPRPMSHVVALGIVIITYICSVALVENAWAEADAGVPLHTELQPVPAFYGPDFRSLLAHKSTSFSCIGQEKPRVLVDRNLNVTFPCLHVMGVELGVIFRYSHDLLWEPDLETIVIPADPTICSHFENDLSLTIPCLEYDDTQFGITFNYSGNGLLWEVDRGSLYACGSPLSPPKRSPCATSPPELPSDGTYRAFSHATIDHASQVAISDRGRLAVAGTVGGKVHVFTSNSANPTTLSLDASVTSVATDKAGSSFVIGTYDGKLHYFECRSDIDRWCYDTGNDTEDGWEHLVDVTISRDGRWIAAMNSSHAYLFRRDYPNPIVALDLSQGRTLVQGSMALSADGSRMAVCSVLGDTSFGWKQQAILTVIGHQGIIWQAPIPDQRAPVVEFGDAWHVVPLALSSNGNVIVGGGARGKVFLWDVASMSPRWTLALDDSLLVSSVALSSEGNKLAFVSGKPFDLTSVKLHFIKDTSGLPNPTDVGNWMFDGKFAYYSNPVYGWLDTWDSSFWEYPAAGGYPVSFARRGMTMSDNGNYLYATSYAGEISYIFHTQYASPIRAFGRGTALWGLEPAGISPDGSWVMTGGNGEILRFEVAPVQKLKCESPFIFRLEILGVETPISYGQGNFPMEFTIIKPGRAAQLKQHWEMAGLANLLPIAVPAVCDLQTTWDNAIKLPDGDVTHMGVALVNAPSCIGTEYFQFLIMDVLADLKSGDGSLLLARDKATVGMLEFNITD